jgi:serine/threonine-protein phosphatase 2A regulatory subunit B''
MVEAPAPADLSAAAQVPALPLQVDLLQLPPEVPAPGAPALRGVLDRLFAHWLSLPDTAALRSAGAGASTIALLASLVHKAKASGGGAAAAMLPSMMLQGGAAVPPLSPRSPRLSRRPSSLGAGPPNRSASPLRPPAARPAKEVIPQVLLRITSVHRIKLCFSFLSNLHGIVFDDRYGCVSNRNSFVMFASFIFKMGGHRRTR